MPQTNGGAAKPNIKAIIFDLGGVIMSGGYLPFLKHYGIESLSAEGKKKIERLEHDVNLGTISETQFYKKLDAILHIHLTPKQMHQTIVKKMQPNKSLLKFIPKLKPAKIDLFTNSIGGMSQVILRERNIPVKKIFGKSFYSNVLHIAKPDPNAYKAVLKKIGLPARQILMVDDRQENIDPVLKLGMHGIVFRSTAQFKREMKKYKLV